MKELSIEGKATRYDKAIEVAQRFYNNSVAITKKGLEDIFPELAESEDERIREALIEYFRWVVPQILSDFDNKKVLAWLKAQGEQPKKHDVCDNCDQQGGCVSPCPMKLVEKHGEQKPADKVEPKFKVGDRIKRIGIGYESWVITDIDEMFNEYKGKYEKGYSTSLSFIEQDNYELVEQKPAWSEEDETALGDALWCCKQAASIAKDENDMGNIWYAENWLKFLKDRVQPQPKQEWSEEDRRMLIGLIDELDAIMNKATSNEISVYSKYTNWLKSLRPQNRWKPTEVQMSMLRAIVNEPNNVGAESCHLAMESLYNDLKNL